MQKKMTILGVIAVLLGIYISRILTNRYGNDGRVIIASIALGISILALLIMVLKKKYIEAIAVLSMILPGIMIFIGIYKDSILLTAAGLLLVFITIPIMIKVLPKYLNR